MARNMLAQSPELSPLVRVVPSSKEIFGLMMNTYYAALSAEGKTAHGDGPLVCILDEAGQVRGDYDAFFEALITSQGAWEKPLLIIISTQAATDGDWLSKEIDDAIDSQDPRIVCHLYTAPEDCALDDEESWKLANPAYEYFFPKQELIDGSQKALRMPSFENTFRNLHLNQRIEAESPFVSKATWQENGAEPDKITKKKVFGGLDLSAVADLTALVFVSEDGDVIGKYWLPAEGIAEKSRADRVPYDVWAKNGFLELTPGKSIEYEYIAHELKRIFDKFDVETINFDRFAMKFLKPWLKKAGLTDKQIEKFNEFGQGFVSMGTAVRELESRLLQGKLKHGNHPVLAMCAGNAKVMTDPAGSRKFTKTKSTGRIDGMVALAMAVDALARYEESKPSKPTLFFV
jgi:phage terminase large subunit-like protein